MTGEIVTLNLDRKFGFIACKGERRPSHFFHTSDLVDLVFDERLAGQRVEFDSERGPKGLAAKNVKPAN